MPTYNFKHIETNEIIEKVMKISERDNFLKENPSYEPVIITAPSLGDPIRLGIKKPDAGFKEVLSKAKEAHPKSTINTW